MAKYAARSGMPRGSAHVTAWRSPVSETVPSTYRLALIGDAMPAVQS